jgi:hypothetical protein
MGGPIIGTPNSNGIPMVYIEISKLNYWWYSNGVIIPMVIQ